MKYYVNAWRQCLDFKGRSTRKEYWLFIATNMVVGLAVFLLAEVMRLAWLPNLYMLLITLPSIAIAVRRFHDTGNTGWWLLLGLVPFVGFLVILYFLLSPSDDEENKYGPNPNQAPSFSASSGAPGP